MPMPSPSTEALDVLRDDGGLALYRGGRGADGVPVLALMVADASCKRLRQQLEKEFALRDRLDAQWSAQPLTLVEDGDAAILWLSDPGGQLLSRRLGHGWETSQFLRVAEGIAAALGGVHRAGLIHRDLKPGNILIDFDSGSAWLTGFAFSSTLLRERQELAPPEVIAGTLAYMAPEQTGRMNRSMDSRSDLYALGVVFYEMLAGTLPFHASDSLEWIHCHVARQPLHLSERLSTLPPMLAAVVMKLLAKTGEERYQTAAGLAADLRRCRQQWESGADIDPFRLGSNDMSEHFAIPEKLYGRESEVSALIRAFERVATRGEIELTLVSGYAGIGKSSVVNELHPIVAQARGLFASGKFDQRLRDTPCSTVAEAFRSLLRQVLNGDAADISRWKQRIDDAVGSHCVLLFELLPELSALMGSRSPLPSLSPLETTQRFQSAFQRFITAIAREDQPLLIFLDDLQRVDTATLALLECIVADPEVRYLHLVGAYRDNEVPAGHPLANALARMRAAGRTVKPLALGPLRIEDVTLMVADALRLTPTQARPLSVFVHQKTGGNPFFAGQFLANLEEEGLLHFDASSKQWRWDEHVIAAEEPTNDLVNVLVRRLGRLPKATRDALQLLSCFGSQAEVATLAILCGSEGAVHERFGPALGAGVLLATAGRYGFLHDRVQEGAYALIPKRDLGAMHLGIGRALSAGVPLEALPEKIFEIANQVNLGMALVSSDSDKLWAAGINLQAALKAKASAAYEAACNYLRSGILVLGTEGWEKAYDLAFTLNFELGECEISCGHLDLADVLVDELLLRGRGKVDVAKATVQRMTAQMMRGDAEQVLQTGIDALATLGQIVLQRPSTADVQAEFDRLYGNLEGRAIEELSALRMMGDAEIAAVMSIMVRIGLASYFVNGNLHRTIAIRLVTLTLDHGLSESSVYGCSGLGSCLGPVFDRHVDGERFARAAVAIADKCGYAAFRAGACVALQEALLWTRPISEAVLWLDEAIRLAKSTGALFFACYAIEHRLTDMLFRGDAIDDVWGEATAGLAFADKSKVRHVGDIIASMRSFVLALRGRAGDVAPDDDSTDVRIQATGIPVVACFHGILQMQRHFLLGDAAKALTIDQKLAPVLWSVRCHVQSVHHRVFQSLAIAACYPQASPDRQQEWRVTLEENVAALQRWAANCPSSFSHKHALVSAELARIDGRDIEALRLYEQAICGATQNDFVQDKAISCELAASFCMSHRLMAVARVHLQDARRAYRLWGAHAKVKLIDEEFSGLDEPASTARALTIDAPLSHVDLAAVVKVLQVLSGEIVHARLIEKLMMITLEHAAAERALLVLHNSEGQSLEAIAQSQADGISVEKFHRPPTAGDLPETILREVLGMNRSVILDDARQPNAFSHDDYLQRKRPRSILCLPLIAQGQVVGVLYFENNLATHVFTPTRHAVLGMLSSQAAISLQNAGLVARLEREIAERKRSEAALRQSEARYALAMEAAADGHADWIVESDVWYGSPRWLQQWGLPPEFGNTCRQEIVDRFPWHPEDRPRVMALLDQVRETGQTRMELDARVIVRGEVRWMHSTTLYVRDASGKLLGASLVTTDVTARRQAEEALRMSEERYALALAGSDESIYDWDLKTDQLYIDPRTQQLLGIPVGPPRRDRYEWASLVHYHPDDAPRRRAAMDAHIAGQTPMFDIELRILLPGGVRWLHQRGRALRDADGLAYRVVGSIGDITERKRGQEEMQRLENRLRQAERFEAMGTLAGGIAHDFNNILGAILGFGDRARRSLDQDSRLYHDISSIVVAGERGRTLVERILSFSRGTGERVPVHVEKVVSEALELLQAKLPPRITLRAQLRAGRAALLGDTTQIHQLLMNLGTNAVHAMTGKGWLSVALDAIAIAEPHHATIGMVAPGPWIVLTIADEGTGITDDALPRIFDPFFTTKEASVGTGLGLSLVLRIVSELGGAIDVRSELHAGTEFTIYLPRSGDAPDEPIDRSRSAPSGHGQRVLVVDDEEALLELTTDTLSELGYDAIGFSSAVVALEAFQAEPDAFAALITDQRMPDVSGDHLIREVRRIRPLLPVILVSGYVGDSALLRPDSGWADEVLAKPLRANALATSLARLLAIHRDL